MFPFSGQDMKLFITNVINNYQYIGLGHTLNSTNDVQFL